MVNRRQSRDDDSDADNSNGNKVGNRKGSDLSDTRRDNSKVGQARGRDASRSGDDRDNLRKRDAPNTRNRKRSGSSDGSDEDNGRNKKKGKFDSSEESGSESDSRSHRSDDSGKKDKKRSSDRNNSDSRDQKPGYDKSTYEVYFGDVSFNAGEDDIRQYFKNCGQILQIKLLTRDDGKSRGRGFIKFSDEKSMRNAIKLNGTELMGRRIVVEQPTNKAPGSGNGRDGGNQESSSIIVRNLPFTFGDNDLSDMFENFGSIKSFRVIKNESGQSKGFGFVDFENAGDAKAALSKSGTDINGRSITVDFSLPKGDRPFNGGGRGFGGGRGRGGYNDRPQRGGYRRND